jgi:CelD/BcsL family acetyltransferase involved in cellulose biosynthesis
MKWTTVATTWQPASAAAAIDNHGLDPAENPERITVSCYENDIPPFIDFVMERLYGSIFSSMKHLRIYDTLDADTHTYVVRSGMKIQTVLLFRREGRRIQVLNEVIALSQDQIADFAKYVFSRFGSVGVICCKAIRTDLRDIGLPFQRFNSVEDIVVTLPATTQEYLASLGKNTRRNIKRYGDKLMRAFPSCTYQVYENADVNEQDVLDIIELNRARMAEKNKVSLIDEVEAKRLVRLAQKCGLVGVTRIDGKVAAGAISFHAGDNFFLSVIAHDPAYDEFWMGILCCYHTICECIARGAKEFHFLWGRYDYKFTLLGVQRDLDNVAVYRSRLAMMRNAGVAGRMAFNGYKRRLSQRMRDAAHEDSAVSRFAVGALNRFRALTRREDASHAARKSAGGAMTGAQAR